MNPLIYPRFQSKVNSLTIIDDLYKDNDFAAYYNATTKLSSSNSPLNDDYHYYTSNIEKNSKILEIGSGNGRIFNRLYNDSYDVYGIEPALEMAKYIEDLGRNRIFPMTLQEFTMNSQKLNPDTVIIPATSISLFSPHDFEKFLNKLMTISSFSNIIFDFLKPSFFVQTENQINVVKLTEGTYYSVNFQYEDSIVFNIISEKHKKLGISRKYLYSFEYFKNLFNELNGELKVLRDDPDYMMIKGAFNGYTQ